MALLWVEHHWWRKSLTRSFTSNEIFHLNRVFPVVLLRCIAFCHSGHESARDI